MYAWACAHRKLCQLCGLLLLLFKPSNSAFPGSGAGFSQGPHNASEHWDHEIVLLIFALRIQCCEAAVLQASAQFSILRP